jgi:cupin fold WbuC family metalloprotein
VIPPSKAVLVSDDDVVALGARDVDELRRLAGESPHRRARYCAHRDASDPLHEMVIVMERSTYVRPHLHPGKTESFHVLEGRLDIAVFDDQGELTDVVRLAAYGSGGPFYCRMNVPQFHTVLVRSDLVVVQETTNGPFDPAAAVFATWAPDPADTGASSRYLARLDQRVSEFPARR